MDQEASKLKASPKDFFLYLAAIITLYVSTWSLLRLVFEIINGLFPDRLETFRDPYSSLMRFAIASLIIVFPAYLLISWYLRNDLARQPEKRELGIRKWLVYLTLFLAGAIIVGDLVALINTFLGGEITTRFILKVLAILAVTGAVFGYYGLDLRRPAGISRPGARTFAGLAALAVLASIVGGFAVMGSPSSLRFVRLDQMRVENLQNIQYQIINNYWRQKQALPAALSDLNNPLENYTVPADPETGAPYQYQAVSSTTFRLCADFRTDSAGSGAQAPAYSKGMPGNENWQHGKGTACFNRTIDPQLYPPVNAKQ